MINDNQIEISLKNCNNIEKAEISLITNELNLRYALNGTGKSTLSKAIELASKNMDLSVLKTFGSSEEPQVTINQSLDEVLVFNEDFVNNTVFRESEVIENGFEVFIKSPEYDRRLASLNQKLAKLKIGIEENEDFLKFINILNSIAQKLKLNNDGSVKNDTILKSLTSKESIFKVPTELEIFKPFLQNSNLNIDWVDWKTKGEKFDDVSGCPFCTKDLGEKYQEQKKLFKKSYKKASTKNLKDMLELIETMQPFMNSEKYNLLLNCIKKESDVDTITQEVTKLRVEVEGVINKFGRIIQFNKLEIKRDQISQIGDILKDSKIQIAGIDYFTADKSKKVFKDVNEKVEELEKIVENLKKDIGAFIGFILGSIKLAKDDINFFLETAGINYELEIIQNNQNELQTILKYVKADDSIEVDKIREHLSWGEKNAFSLVLFMHYALSRNADLIILDDPISSFDDNKKYAIINRLFGKHSAEKSFYGKTILMLSHDFEPVIDFIINSKPTGGLVNAEHYWNRNGSLECKSIESGNVNSWISLLKRYARNESFCLVNRLAFLRKYIELNMDSSDANFAYQIVSSLQHGYHTPQIKNEDELINMNQLDIEKGEAVISKFIIYYNYSSILTEISNEANIRKWYSEQSNNYFKLQIFRRFLEVSGRRDQIKDNNLLKYIDETYHIENDYIYFLDLEKFEIVPDHIIQGCDSFIK